MLGNVYGDDAPAAEAGAAADTTVVTRPVAKLPEWADEDVLDEAFAQWVPGPPADAPAAERSMLSELAASVPTPTPTPAPAPVAPSIEPVDLGASELDALSSPLDDLYQPMVDPALAEATARSAVEHALSRGWQRCDDDILPVKSGGRSKRLARK